MFKRVQSGNLYVGSTPLLTYLAYPWLQKVLTRQPAITRRGKETIRDKHLPPKRRMCGGTTEDDFINAA